MAVQDDRRENEMRELFELEKAEGEGRGGTDAILWLDGTAIPFELKSTTDYRGSVTTVRDFGPDHIEKWRSKHWLIGFYDRAGLTLAYSIYGSPAKMAPWIHGKEAYIGTDISLASILPEHLTMVDMKRICGDTECCSDL